ncbi:MAG: hypothetical protein QF570_14520 [Myxococcota bacterium]|nr:hypothetical protein [Myxococcota bacterium]
MSDTATDHCSVPTDRAFRSLARRLRLPGAALFLLLSGLVGSAPALAVDETPIDASVEDAAMPGDILGEEPVAVPVAMPIDETSASGGAVEPPPTGGWLPTTPGARSTYVYIRERSRAVEGQPAEVEKIRGTRIDEVAARDPQYSDDVIRIDTKLHAKSAKAAGEVNESHSAFYRVTRSRVELVAERSADPTSASDVMTRYEVPLSILESNAEPGQRWQVGVQSQRDLHTNLEGEVLGVQAVETPAGSFELCLVIRLTGQISGVVEAYGTRMEVPSGDVTITRWYAPGAGLVLAKEERNQTFVLEDGTQMNYSERTQFALRSAETERAVPPAALAP